MDMSMDMDIDIDMDMDMDIKLTRTIDRKIRSSYKIEGFARFCKILAEFLGNTNLKICKHFCKISLTTPSEPHFISNCDVRLAK